MAPRPALRLALAAARWARPARLCRGRLARRRGGPLQPAGAWLERALSERTQRLLFGLATAAACAAPLLLGLFGWDVYRWIFLSLAGASATAVLLANRVPPEHRARRIGLGGLAVVLLLFVVLACGFGVDFVYFDQYTTRDRGTARRCAPS